MLDLSPPAAEHIYEAAIVFERVLDVARRMTLAPSVKRLYLFDKCRWYRDNLRRLNRAHYGGSRRIAAAIAEVEKGLWRIARLGGGKIVDDRSDGEGACAACRSPIRKVPIRIRGRERTPGRSMIYCRTCLRRLDPALKRLSSLRDGFGTEVL